MEAIAIFAFNLVFLIDDKTMIQIIEAAWENRELLKEEETVRTIEQVIDDLDKVIRKLIS